MSLSRVQVAKGFLSLADEKGYEYAVQSLAAYAKTNKMDSELLMKDISRELEKRGLLTVELHSARKLNDSAKVDILNYLQELTETKQVTSIEHVDAELIGGVKAITSEYVLDWTVRGRLEKLMKQGGING